MKCPNCHTQATPVAKYCTACGSPIPRDSAVPQPGSTRTETAEPRPSGGISVRQDVRTVGPGGSVVGFQFNQRYPALKDYAYNFSELISAITRGFVGRDFIFRQLQEFQERHPCGYLRIVADAGLGKTALAAAVACRYKAPAFFANSSRGLTRPDQCLNHLSAELIARSELVHDHLPDRAGEDSNYLGQMLADAVQKSSDPLWIVVDALDEADKPSPGRNTLLLPDRLPQGVYFLLTHCPGEYPLTTDARTPVGEYTIAWDAPAQKTDIRRYLLSQAEKPAIRGALAMATPPISPERFISDLEEASEGNFKYLDYVITDIASGEPGFVPLDLDTLPRGLKGYYEQFWSHIAPAPEEDRREVREEWEQIYQPVIAFLGATKEPVTAEWLAALVGCHAKKIRERALRRWQRFLHQDQVQRTWRVVHRSFTDFLAKKMDEAEWRAFHARIADRYLAAWGGLEAGIPGLHDLVKLDNRDVRYGLRHLAAHLEAAGREDELHRLMQLEWSDHQGEQTRVRFENTWYTVHERVGDTSGYLSDVDRAWRLTEEAFTDRRSPIAIGLQCRYALIVTSLCSLAGNIPPALLAALVEKGICTGLQGWAYARQIQEPELRSRVLAALAPRLRPTERDQALREALEVARAIGDDRTRSQALAALAPHLGLLGLTERDQALRERDQALREALKAVWASAPHFTSGAGYSNYSTARAWSEALAALVPHLTEPLLRQALETARAVAHEWHGPQVLAALAPRLAELGLPTEALEAARASGNCQVWSQVLAARAPHLGPTQRDQALREALEAARANWNLQDRPQALAALAPHLGPTERDQALRGRWRRRGRWGMGGPDPRRWLRWPPTWGRPSGTRPCARRWRRRRPSGTGSTDPRRWRRWPPTWGRPSGTRPCARRWRRRWPSRTSTGPTRWPRWPPI